MRKILIVVMLAAVAVGAIVATGAWEPWVDDAAVVDPGVDRAIAESVSVRTLTDEITIRGELRRDELQVVTAALDGKVGHVAVADGDTVEAGDPLLRLNAVDYEADLESARALLARTESEARRARKELRRQRRLADRSVASQARIDDAETAAHVAEASLREAQARLGRAERDLERTEIYAPYSGRVRSERVDPGQFVSRGEALAKIYAVDYAEVRLPIPDRELRYLDVPLGYRDAPRGHRPAVEEIYAIDDLREVGELGEKQMYGPGVVLKAEFAGENHVWQGQIVRTEGEIDPKSRMVTVVARIEDPYGRKDEDARPPLSVGLFVEVEIAGRVVPNAMVIPRSALHEGGRVLVLDSENRLHYRAVDVLRTERELVIVEAGLEAGERVAVSPLPDAIEGMLVRAREAEGSPGRERGAS